MMVNKFQLQIIGIVLGGGILCFSGFLSQPHAGPLDSVTKSIESGGGYVERTSGSRSDTAQFPIYRYERPQIKVQIPKTYKVSKSKSTVKAVSKNGASLLIRFDAVSEKAGWARHKKEKQQVASLYKDGKLLRKTDKKINNVSGVESQKGERNGPLVE